MSFSDVPDEIITSVLAYLSGPDLRQISLINRRLHRLTQDQRLWYTICREDHRNNETKGAIHNQPTPQQMAFCRDAIDFPYSPGYDYFQEYKWRHAPQHRECIKLNGNNWGEDITAYTISSTGDSVFVLSDVGVVYHYVRSSSEGEYALVYETALERPEANGAFKPVVVSNSTILLDEEGACLYVAYQSYYYELDTMFGEILYHDKLQLTSSTENEAFISLARLSPGVMVLGTTQRKIHLLHREGQRGQIRNTIHLEFPASAMMVLDTHLLVTGRGAGAALFRIIVDGTLILDKMVHLGQMTHAITQLTHSQNVNDGSPRIIASIHKTSSFHLSEYALCLPSTPSHPAGADLKLVRHLPSWLQVGPLQSIASPGPPSHGPNFALMQHDGHVAIMDETLTRKISYIPIGRNEVASSLRCTHKGVWVRVEEEGGVRLEYVTVGSRPTRVGGTDGELGGGRGEGEEREKVFRRVFETSARDRMRFMR
ncbi:hypothetical protein SAICODRAFT_212324 [Saitoella complicata NRRL Y-17804]|uniref:F-box domain-containing protein n=1 Tax=Saitoella complicata (strain BCRC 22490 / CBS 7301 / JCM 7358 / NBRC 10748 / NRRL Y-17804) TaxID=698492 RepID=A0A0E9NJM4_SAICN|nr:uncharacterized protein SAICODRAFT_212324 [Saitoella complicata NRRL Y-17804]ODQ54549.1 hypothetical protein SAICODRAFT_212324 [Saitoella complicata NRRL Y-17804]GAO50082.1 hypothetical protein G7K_4217-t1 [Saitoella complicata NRRL Y-17804]